MAQLERSAISGFSSKFRQSSFPYDVKREVYNEETFQQEHKRKASSSGNMNINITTFTHHVQCRCSWHRFLRCMLTIFPFLEWMCMYRLKDWLLGDLLAGISVGLMQVPQGLTLSLLARQLIPPLNIAYAAFCSSVIYVIFGSCHQMSIGSFFLVSALLINVLKISPFNNGHLVMGSFLKDEFSAPSYLMGYNKSLSVVATTTFLTGIIQLIMGVLGLGFIATYLPESAVSAYLAAVALHIMLSQLTCIFGIMISFHAGPISFFYDIINYCVALPKANSTSILLFLTVVVALRINKCIRISFNQYPIEFPMELFLIIGFTVIANKITMATETSQTLIDMIPYSFLFPVTPDFSVLPKIILQAISLSLVSSFLLIFLGKKIASLHNYSVNSNQDLIAIGLCNVVSSFFRSCVFTGAVARTIIQDKSGGRQQFASLVGAGVMLLLMVKMGHFFYALPNAVLAGIILSNVVPYLETISNLPSLWRQDQYDCALWMMTFSSSIFLGLDIGLIISVVSAFFITSVRSHRAKILLLGQIPNTNIYRSVNDYREIITIPGVKIFQCCSSITFVNVYYLKHKLLKEVGMVRVPLKEEEIFSLFNSSDTSLQGEKICRCFCNCDDLEPLPRILYTERFENKLDPDASSVNLIHCSHFESVNTSQTASEDQVPYTVSSMSQKNQGQQYEEVEKVWLPNNSSRNSSPGLPDVAESQGRRSLIPYSDASLLPSVHTIILDFSMVHYVDSQGLVVLRQICNAFRNANILILIAGCHSSIVRAFERNDFFDAGITKTQLFLSVHDAVLFALSRKVIDSSELSIDESETVIRETYSETEKNDNSIYKMSSSFLGSQKNVSPGFTKIQQPVEEESELDLELESEQEAGLGLDLDLDRELEPESELEPEMEPKAETETETETEMEPQPETEPEMEPDPKSRSRAHTFPQQHYWPTYHPRTASTQSQTQPRTWSVERRRHPMDSYSPEGNSNEDV
ncbi:testis anion transporter 1 isoform X1 [Macaca thibetana thibetana]|uniref:testis anion transporter 1 isoform X1 n=1 Tax=Macaca thibetana thibetana TaxID=257877 RepID=UPI0021BCC799|nr:testis anion transporter 1 isoform X1 [Macaca thibetana thibetana]XP_050643535.1 testis anion transporter 1 isoform X1 [Macaca thibetana thibetana]XP_050643536.1 testis anion transporter 1 isoform X1 [Macaca thibetana thibetana]XP_050643537.1 testis anion transporter 1 isoform X1 [Macaca thibetana thibetana]